MTSPVPSSGDAGLVERECERVTSILHEKFGVQLGFTERDVWMPIAKAAIRALTQQQEQANYDSDVTSEAVEIMRQKAAPYLNGQDWEPVQQEQVEGEIEVVGWRARNCGDSTWSYLRRPPERGAWDEIDHLIRLTDHQAIVARLTKERDEAQADAYRSSILAIDRLAEVDKAKARASANWCAFRDLRLSIIGDGPMCRDCADADGRCPSSGRPCNPDEAVREQLATWRSAEGVNLLDGDGWVFWNPGSGEEYSESHPLESGECEDAEQIRNSTSQEDVLWRAMQQHFSRAQAAERKVEELTEALEFYRDGFSFHTNPRYGGLKWKPTEALLDDCGNTARAALNGGAK